MTLQLSTLQVGPDNVAVVPARVLSWHQVQLPAGTLPKRWMKDRSTPRLRAILEGLLEDRLLDDPSQLHFALQPNPRNEEPVWVAVCNRTALRTALQDLQLSGKPVRKVVPEWAPRVNPAISGRVRPPSLWLTGTEDAAQLVWTDTDGVHSLPVSRSSGLPSQLPAQLARESDLRSEPAVSKLAEALLRRPARVVPTARRLKAAAQGQWNLAQFDLSIRNPLLMRLGRALNTFWTEPLWAPARWAALAAVVLQVVGLNAYAWHTQSQLDQQSRALRETLVSTFPHVTVVLDAPVQMEREVATLRQASGAASPRDLETLLGVVGSFGEPALFNNTPSAIDYVAGELRLVGLNVEPEAVGAFNQVLQPQGFSSTFDTGALVVRPRSGP
jgi:general secretion pathway protein L